MWSKNLKALGWPLGETASEATPKTIIETATVEPAPLITDSVGGNKQRSEIDGKRHSVWYFQGPSAK